MNLNDVLYASREMLQQMMQANDAKTTRSMMCRYSERR